jgi:uncharacterized protein YraI
VDPGSSPSTNPTQPTAPTAGLTITARPYTLNIRSGPGTQFPRLARLPAGQTASLVGRTADRNWLQVNFNGILGWVTAEYSVLSPSNANLDGVAVTG